MVDLSEKWQSAFWGNVQRHRNAGKLREAAINGNLGDWTRALTSVVVTTCEAMGWSASAKGHQADVLPVSRSEYLGLDVIAFAGAGDQWVFPLAVMELENSRNDAQICYSLWKVLCVNADLRAVFCYRQNSDQGPALIRFLRDQVLQALNIENRMTLKGATIIVVGSRNDSETFPYGFFKWWRLEKNTGCFELI
jgi:hypothetical protein